MARPAWLTPQRKRACRPRVNGRPSARRPQATERLLAGLTYKQIAAELGLAVRTITQYAHQVCRQYGVHSGAELARRLGRPAPPPGRGRRRAKESVSASPSSSAAASAHAAGNVIASAACEKRSSSTRSG